ncbi:GHMP family kinase ATP-binding protein [Paenibacillus hexagrammi]|uniref:GHMP kinase n=1 Tax=Paenibacillus hexagrammi TaxID=2908839 RepID=A0ABY3SDG8_9BACL|nr:hypothetical protein [Paenibacillus sp. YPD9-1]UJF31862.1 hypothetical protein L0M14_19150 [Paenibacillus sp. YPD9-1]
MIISQTPLRISFTGGGTDIPGFYTAFEGAVISTTINKYIYVAVKPRFDRRIRVVTTQIEEVTQVEEIKHDLVREALKKTAVHSGVEIVILADVPAEGSGLGSSGALTVGLLNALYTYQGKDVSAEELAEQACEIEIEQLKQPIGKQDQYAAALGGLRYYHFHKNGSVVSEYIQIAETQKQDMQKNLLLFYSGITRSASAILQRQGEQLEQKKDYLLQIKEQCALLKREIETGCHSTLGSILHEGWQWKKQLADGITNPQIDNWYETALQAGALGGKIAGAGGGGFLMLYAEQDIHSRLRDELPLQEMDFGFDNRGTRIILGNEGAGEQSRLYF